MGNKVTRENKLFSALKRISTMVVVMFLSLTCFAGCATDAIREAFYGNDSSFFDELGRERLSPVSVSLITTNSVLSSTSTKDNKEYVEVTDDSTGSLVWQESPYAHSRDNVSGVVFNYRWTDYKIVQDGAELYFKVASSLQADIKNYAGAAYTFIGYEEMLKRFDDLDDDRGVDEYGNPRPITSNAGREGSSAQLNTYYPLDSDYDFYLYDPTTDSYGRVGKNHIQIQYRLVLMNASTNTEAEWKEFTDDKGTPETADDTTYYGYKTIGAMAYYNTIEYRVVYNPHLSAGTEHRTIRVKKLVQEGSKQCKSWLRRTNLRP